jgi:hypothetical protein
VSYTRYGNWDGTRPILEGRVPVRLLAALEVGEGARTKYSCIATQIPQKSKRGRCTGQKKWYWIPLPVVFGTVDI